MYANAPAVKALQGKQAFPDGSVIVFDLLDNPEAGGAYTEGKRKLLATMVKDSKKYSDTAGWGFQGWAEGNRQKPALKTATEQQGCLGCHMQMQKTGYVFTEWRP